jgi:predicted PhzF superfamily epimerase YddE/YHI9
MQLIPFYQVDAFTSRIFGGNPAAICPLQEWLPDDTLKSLTIEHNQSETAFFVPIEDGFELRWFTSLGEIDLCGHATLASAHVIFNHLSYPKNEIRFITRFVGDLKVKKDGEWMILDLPAWPPQALAEIPDAAIAGLGGGQPQKGYLKRDYMFVFPDQQDILAIKPDFKILAQLGRMCCVTAPGKDCDFVSRFFCPGDAVEEDPVTGSAHSMLTAYWAERLGKNKLFARQLSKRGGELHCRLESDRVLLSGQAKTYMAGTIYLS